MLVQDGVEGGGDLVHRQEILFREGCGDELDVEHLAQLCGGFDGRGSIPSMPSSTQPATIRTSGLLPMRSTSIDNSTAESLPPEIATRTVVGPSMVSCFRSSRPTFLRTERSRWCAHKFCPE